MRVFWMLFFITFINVPQVFADEFSSRLAMQKEVRQLFWKKDFQALNEKAENFRKTQSRTTSGIWELSVFYGGLTDAVYHKSFSHEKWQEIFKMADEWVAAYPDSPTAHNAKALFYIRYAQKIRGNGYSKDVLEGNWNQFFYYICLGAEHLLKTKVVSSRDPEWYRLMSEAHLHLNEKEAYTKLMDEGYNRYPLYYEMYFANLVYLLPAWHGDKNKIEEFVNEAVLRTKDKEGMGIYTRIYWVASQWYYRGRIFDETAADWLKMREGMQDILRKYPDQWNINSFAYFSCIAKDKQATKELMDKIDMPVIAVWRDLRFFERCKSMYGR